MKLQRNVILLALSLFVLLSAFSASAMFKGIDAINLTSPINQTWTAGTSMTFLINVTGNSTTYSCTLYHDIGQVWGSSAIVNATVQNNSVVTLLKESIADNSTGYSWNLGCTISADVNSSVIMAVTNNTFRVDTIAPIPRPYLYGPSNWTINNTELLFGVNVTELNPASCFLETNLNESLNSSGGADWWNTSANFTPSYSDRIPFNFTFGILRQWGRSAWLDNNTGVYKWNAACNDSAGNIGRIPSGNVTFFVDTVFPTQPNQTMQKNFTKSTDLTPLFQWMNVTELNFSRYSVLVDNDSDFTSLTFQKNITSMATNLTLISGLSYDSTYYWRISAFDLAGHEQNSSTVFTYRTDRTCGVLVTGWNICAFIQTTAQNASTICSDVGCTYVAKYNASHEFQTYTSGASTNAGMIFNASNFNRTMQSVTSKSSIDSVVFIYVASNSTWENRTWEVDTDYVYFNLTNASTGWNIVPILDQNVTYTFASLDRSVNGNLSEYVKANNSKFMSYYQELNATGYKYIPYVSNRSINNATVIPYGDVVWVFFNKSVEYFEWNSSGEI